MIGAFNEQKIKEAFNFRFGKTTSDLIKEKKKSIRNGIVFLSVITALDVFLSIFLMKNYGGDVITFGRHTNTLFFLLNIMTVVVIAKMVYEFSKIQKLTEKGNLMIYWKIVAAAALSFYIPSIFTPSLGPGCFSPRKHYTVEIGENYKAIVDADRERINKIIEERIADFNNQEMRRLKSIQ